MLAASELWAIGTTRRGWAPLRTRLSAWTTFLFAGNPAAMRSANANAALPSAKPFSGYPSCPSPLVTSPLPRRNFALFFTRESDVGIVQCIMLRT
jgi:hypothetical protein